MKLNATLAVTAVTLLAACGGGSSGTSNNPTVSPAVPCPFVAQKCRLLYGGRIVDGVWIPSSGTTPPANTAPPSNTTSVSPTTLKQYNDGSGVVSASPNFGSAGGPSNIIVAATNLQAATEVVSGSINLQEVPGTAESSGRFYVIQRTGTASNGASLVVTSFGESLNLQGTEYASISVVAVYNTFGISSGGTQVSGIPTGTYNYSGPASVIDMVDATFGDGTFNMTANFTTNTGSIAATVPANSPTGSANPAFFFSSNNIAINQADGSFSSSNALIGRTGVSSNAASINGYFAGTNATGVHGLVYTNAPASASHLGAFYGSR